MPGEIKIIRFLIKPQNSVLSAFFSFLDLKFLIGSDEMDRFRHNMSFFTCFAM